MRNCNRTTIRKLGYLFVLHDETLVNTRLEHFHHLGVIQIVADVFENIAIGDDAKGAENDPNGNVGFDVREGCADDVSKLGGESSATRLLAGESKTYSFLRILVEHLDLHDADHFSTLLHRTTDFGQERYWRRLTFRKDIHMVGSHPLLRDEHLLRAVDDEITTLNEACQ